MPSLKDITKKDIKKYGEGTIIPASQAQRDFIRIPTGIFPLDFVVGGGFPIWATSSVYGPPGGGKTMVLYKLVAGAQKLCWNCFEYQWDCECDSPTPMKVVWVDTEASFDLEFAQIMGVDPDRLMVVNPEYGEQASDIIVEMLKAEDVGLVVLDSLPMLTPIDELESPTQDAKVALQARLISRFIRKVKTVLIREKKYKHPVAFVCSNQIRAKISSMLYGPTEEVPGGNTSKHDWHLMFRMSQIKSKEVDKETGLVNKGKFHASLAAMGNKKKLRTLGGAAEFMVVLSNRTILPIGTVDDYDVVFKYATDIGLIDTASGYDVNGTLIKTKRDILQYWRDDDNAFLSMKRKVVDAYLLQESDITVTLPEDLNTCAEDVEENL